MCVHPDSFTKDTRGTFADKTASELGCFSMCSSLTFIVYHPQASSLPHRLFVRSLERRAEGTCCRSKSSSLLLHGECEKGDSELENEDMVIVKHDGIASAQRVTSTKGNFSTIYADREKKNSTYLFCCVTVSAILYNPPSSTVRHKPHGSQHG